MSNLQLRPISELLGRHFFIPSYQRGYRWQFKQVNALLNDIWEFIHLTPRPQTYCLQPIVIKKIADTEKFEVIDGQQRLTTIYLLLRHFELYIEDEIKNLGSIDYETRNTKDYLNEIPEELKEDNIDFFHIFNANETILKWFKNIAKTTNDRSPKSTFVSPFLMNVKVIWYEVEPEIDSIDVFTRLNIGKIPLTDAELIKASFLRKSNFTKEEQESDAMYLKHIKIASEWNAIEAKLQSNEFWYFIYNPSERNYDKPRIEYLFDLMAQKKNQNDDQETYLYFDQKFKDELNHKKNGKPDTDKLWLEVKQYFQTLEDWFQNREWFHLIGFLIASNTSIASILDLTKEEGELINKTRFEEKLTEEIRDKVKVQVDDLHYRHKKVKMILLLFNVITLNRNKNSSIRFPFEIYKKTGQRTGYDVEHVCSQTPLEIKDGMRPKWLEHMLMFFTGEQESKNITAEDIDQLEEEDQEIVKKLIAINSDDIDLNKFELVLNEVTKRFKENKIDDDINRIGNLALLNSDINRGYKNAMFPLKRQWLLEEEKNGTYIPLCTKNVFMKSYSTKITEIMYWQKSDANSYENAIKETLKAYLPEQTQQ